MKIQMDRWTDGRTDTQTQTLIHNTHHYRVRGIKMAYPGADILHSCVKVVCNKIRSINTF